MSNTSESPESSCGDAALNVKTDHDPTRSEERLAALLLRLLGVYFVAWAIISGIEEAVRLVIASNKYGLRDVFPGHWVYVCYSASMFAVGAYLLIGGQWVFEKVLIPLVPDPLKDDLANVDQEASDDQAGTVQ